MFKSERITNRYTSHFFIMHKSSVSLIIVVTKKLNGIKMNTLFLAKMGRTIKSILHWGCILNQ